MPRSRLVTLGLSAAAIAAVALATPRLSGFAAPAIAGVRLPPGFSIAVYADGLDGARQMAMSPAGTLYVGSREGRVYAVPDRNGDGRGDETITVARGLTDSHGVAFHDGALYVSERARILRYDGIEDRLARPPEPVVVTADLPDDRHHGFKTIAFGPDGRLYVSVGTPCNICDRGGDVYGTIRRGPAAGGPWEVVARGIRNSVGFDWHPETGELWFTDNGRDFLGDDRPPDELNRVTEPGRHFGFPFCHGGDLPDPEFGSRRPCGDFVPPVQKLGPHVASLGMAFYTGGMFPPEYRNQVFIAEHGSWNRSRPIGYRVTLVRLEQGRAASYAPFAEGWLEGFRASGRPVDVLVARDGALLVSDDAADAVYRIAYRRP